jgi:hypothetical protein
MVHLGANEELLGKYQSLSKEDLRANSSVADPNARGLCYEGLAWFWSLDVPGDTASNDWMSECEPYLGQARLSCPDPPIVYRVHWLRAKALRDRWAEEKELLEAEFQWTINYFGARSDVWEYRSIRSRNKGQQGQACYAARQQAIYSRLRDQCQAVWEDVQPTMVDVICSGPIGDR